MKWVAGGLVMGIGIWSVPSCTSYHYTPMRGSADCRYVPSVEDCQAVADRIEDYCLKTCVLHLCRGNGRAVCDENAQVGCVELSKEHPGDQTNAWVFRGSQTCEMPIEEVNWCQVPHTPPCQALIMVHELAHACGWRHGEGKGVPADNGSVKCQ